MTNAHLHELNRHQCGVCSFVIKTIISKVSNRCGSDSLCGVVHQNCESVRMKSVDPCQVINRKTMANGNNASLCSLFLRGDAKLTQLIKTAVSQALAPKKAKALQPVRPESWKPSLVLGGI